MNDNAIPIRAYLDFNIIDDLAKELLPLNCFRRDGIEWIYSNEHFTEIHRAKEDYCLDVLNDLGAKRLEQELDQHLLTDALILSAGEPRKFYKQWEDTVLDTGDISGVLTPFIARSFGAANDAEYAALPKSITESVAHLLESEDLPTHLLSEIATEVGRLFEAITEQHMRERVFLEDIRAAMGTHGGRAGNLQGADNPLQALWETIRKAMPDLDIMGAEQFFGFDPPYNFGYERFPLFLGIISCYTVLNSIGYRPDEKLSRASRTAAVMSDASHVAYAAYCDALVSGDKRMCDKASAIYRYKKLPVTVVHLEKGKAG